MRFTLTMLLTISCLLLSGCGNWAGNPKKPEDETDGDKKTNVTLEIRGDNPGASLMSETIPVFDTSGASAGNVVLTSARVSLRKIKLLATNGSDAHDAEFAGPYIANLLNDMTTPDVGSIEIPAGEYDTMKLQLAKLEEDEAEGIVSQNDPLIRNSIHLMGSVQSGQASQSFSMLFDLDEEFFIALSEESSTVDITEDEVTTIVISFDLSRWFDFTGEDYDLSDLGGESIVLDKESEDPAKKVRETIKDLVKESAEFSKDESDQ